MHMSHLHLGENLSKEIISSQEIFQCNIGWKVERFTQKSALVPSTDPFYFFDHIATKAILLGFSKNQRVLLQGLHGSGKSTHIEQVAARLNWPCLRINLDGHITRADLLGRDVIRLTDGKPITLFQEGLLPWAIQQPIALVLDEYDAARPEVLFVLQQLLEQEGHLTLIDENKRITPHPDFRIFATANTLGMGDITGLYFGTHPLNQGQLDRWNIVAKLSYMEREMEQLLVQAKNPDLDSELVHDMVAFADLTRIGFYAGDIPLPMSPRGVLTWANHTSLLRDVKEALTLCYINRFEEDIYPLLNAYYQKAFKETGENKA